MQNYNLTATSKRCTSVNAYEFPVIIKSLHSQDAPKSFNIYDNIKTLSRDIQELFKLTPEVQVRKRPIKRLAILAGRYYFCIVIQKTRL